MALTVGQPRRRRSSTGASRGLDSDEKDSATADLIPKLSVEKDRPSAEELSQALEAANNLKRELFTDHETRSIFRHGKGFEAIIEVLQPVSIVNEVNLALYGQLVRNVLLLLSEATNDHRGNERYFAGHLKGWGRLEESLSPTLGSLSERDEAAPFSQFLESLFESLVAAALRDESFALHVSTAKNDDIDISSSSRVVLSGTEILFDAEACALALRLSLPFASDTKFEDGTSLGVILQLWRTVTALVELNSRNRIALWQNARPFRLITCNT